MKSRYKEQTAPKNLFEVGLRDQLDQRHELYQLAELLPWGMFEEKFSPLYAEKGRPAKPIRRMVGLLYLKQLKNLSDEGVCESWRESPYVQYFCGETHFCWGWPCDPSELTYFRKRIGESGIKELFRASVDLHREEVEKETEIVVDTTVQEANVTYPTDVKLRRKILERLWMIGKRAGVKWDHSYRRKVVESVGILRTRSNRLTRKRRLAQKRLKTYAGRLIRELERKLDETWKFIYRDELALYKKVLSQNKDSAERIYSLHDPTVQCIGKGKAHKKWEFGRKASIGMTRDGGVIISAASFDENIYDGDTLWESIWQAQMIGHQGIKSALVDRGYRGRPEVYGVKILTPETRRKKGTAYQQKKERKRYARRAAVEPVIGHLKSDFRMARCFLKGAKGASVNVMMAAAAWNINKWILKLLFWLYAYLFAELMHNRQPASKAWLHPQPLPQNA